jgi:hypothetical protein
LHLEPRSSPGFAKAVLPIAPERSLRANDHGTSIDQTLLSVQIESEVERVL